MKIEDLRYDKVEDYFAGNDDTDMELVQLTPGRLDFLSTQVSLPSIDLQWNHAGASIRCRDVYRSSGLLFGFTLESPGTIKLCGQELDMEDTVVWHPAQETEYVVPAGVSSLIIHVKNELTDQLGWEIGSGPTRRGSNASLLRLRGICEWATGIVRAQTDDGNNGEGGQTPVIPRALRSNQMQDWILAGLEVALAPWMDDADVSSRLKRDIRHAALVRNAESLLDQDSSTEVLSVDALAEKLGVPRRTLFHAFRQWLGMGPHSYLKLVRLHKLRAKLIAADPDHSTVATFAHELGFTQLGHLSASYKAHFGEFPKETLKRR